MRREEADGVVAPVVAQAGPDQTGVVDELVHRHELDGRHPEVLEVSDEGRVGDPAVGPAQLRLDVGMADGGPLDVGLVDDGVTQGDAGRPVTGPVEERVGDDRAGCVRPRCPSSPPSSGRGPGGSRATDATAWSRRWPWRTGRGGAWRGCHARRGPDPTARGAPVAVVLGRPDVGQVGVERSRGPLREQDPLLRVVVEQAQLDGLRHLREDREVRACAVVGGAERERAARPLPPPRSPALLVDRAPPRHPSSVACQARRRWTRRSTRAATR